MAPLGNGQILNKTAWVDFLYYWCNFPTLLPCPNWWSSASTTPTAWCSPTPLPSSPSRLLSWQPSYWTSIECQVVKKTHKSSCSWNLVVRTLVQCFLAVQNSSIGLIVRTCVPLLPLTIRDFTTLQSDPRDLWPLRHFIRVMRRHDLMTIFDDIFWWQFFMTIFYDNFLWQFLTIENLVSDNHAYMTIKSDSGQHSQFMRCLLQGLSVQSLWVNIYM